jgi:hypothetical protein
MKKISLRLCLATVYCLLPICLVHAQTNNLPANGSVMPSWTQSVVKIRYVLGGDTLTGAGVIVSSSGYVLTAAHVGSSLSGKPGTVISIGLAKSLYAKPEFLYTATEVNNITDDNTYDLKLLKINKSDNVQLTFAAFASTVPFPGDEISIAGFPDLPVKFLPQKLGSFSIYKTAILSCYSETRNDTPTRLHYGGGSLPGFSGGPVFNSNGQLIGIHSARFTANIENLFYPEKPCADPQNAQRPCFGNTIRFQVVTAHNKIRTQEINLDYNALKSILDNYSWGTSIWNIPQQWIDKL